MVISSRRQSLSIIALGAGQCLLGGCEPVTVAAITVAVRSAFIFVAKEVGMAITKKIIAVGVDAAWNSINPSVQAPGINQTTRQLAARYGVSDVDDTKIWYQEDLTGYRANSGSLNVRNLSDDNLSAMIYLALQDVQSGKTDNLVARGVNLRPKIDIPLTFNVNILPSAGKKRVIVTKVVSANNTALHCSSNSVDVCVLPAKLMLI